MQKLPWHHRQWEMLEAALEQDKLHHALLVHGQRGLGKQQFVDRLAALLLCESTLPARGRPCGECRSCNLLAAHSHPDQLRLHPDEGKTQISVAQIRALISEQLLTSHYGGYRVVLLAPADALNSNAANALLKTLEEPPTRYVFILLSERPTALPATLRSRCLSILINAPPKAQVIDWLSQASDVDMDWEFLLHWTGTAPLTALETADTEFAAAINARLAGLADLVSGRKDPLAIAEQWQKSGMADVLDWQLRLISQLMRQRTLSESAAQAALPALAELTGHLDFPGLNRLYDAIMELRDAQLRNLNPNDKLALEGLAVTWRLASSPVTAPN